MKTRILITIVLSILFFSSCEDFLDKSPYGSVSESTFYKTENDAKMAVNAVYAQLRGFNAYGAFYFHTDIWADDCEKGGGGPADNPDLLELQNFDIQTSNGLPGGIWNAFFSGVYKANVAIKKITQMPDFEIKNRLINEAKFLRALCYYNLVIRFGGVPLISDPDQENIMTVQRSSSSDVWNFIITDLIEAEKNLLPSYSGEDIGRATKGAVQGLLGRAYLHTEQWQKASDTYSSIIKSHVYDLLDNYADNFLNIGGDNLQESLFEIQFATGTGDTNNGFQRHGWIRPRDVPSITWSGNGFCLPTQTLVDAFEKDDLRRQATVMVDGDDVFGTVYSSSWSSTGYNAMKYVYGPGVMHVEADANFKVIRYSEVLLGYAEAVLNGATENDEITGLQALNKVRKRAGLDELSTLTFDAIVHERRVEFAMEGLRFFDVVRWGIALQTFGEQFTVNRDELMPIPVNELLMNPNLEQNPGY